MFIDGFFSFYGQIFVLEFGLILFVGLLSGFLSSKRLIGKENF